MKYVWSPKSCFLTKMHARTVYHIYRHFGLMGTGNVMSEKNVQEGWMVRMQVMRTVCSAKKARELGKETQPFLNSVPGIIFGFIFTVLNGHLGLKCQIICGWMDRWMVCWIQGSAAHECRWIWFPLTLLLAVSHCCSCCLSWRCLRYKIDNPNMLENIAWRHA